jgi:serine/threonine-protein kinase
VLKIGHYNSNTTLERIKREVAILSKLKSVYFPISFDFQIVDQSRYLILEELINGQTLDKEFQVFSSEFEACILLDKLLLAMTLLWTQKVIHRDLKPENIIISNKEPRILDLGIARILDETSLTCSFAPFGPCTPNYASPEQLQNRKNSIDHRTDQFSLGIILGQLLLKGEHPFCPSILGNKKSIPENINADIWAKELLKTKTSMPVYNILEKMLGHEPYQRKN